jgi:transcriptional regulator with XRE-family HTH domain
MLMRHAIGDVLRKRRLELSMTLRQVAELSRISLPYLSEVERGRKEPSSEIIEAICLVLGMDVDELLTEAARVLAGQRVRTLEVLSTTSAASPVGALTRGSVQLAA